MPAHALPPAENRARIRARRRRGLRTSLLAGLPIVIVSAVLRTGGQEPASVTYYLAAVPFCAGVIAAFAAGSYAARQIAAVSVARRPRWLYGLAAALYSVPVAIFVRIAASHVADHTANDDSWAAMAGGIVATLCALAALLMLGRAVVPGRWRRCFWLYPPLWLDEELGTPAPPPASPPPVRPRW